MPGGVSTVCRELVPPRCAAPGSPQLARPRHYPRWGLIVVANRVGPHRAGAPTARSGGDMSGYGSGDRPGDEDPWRPPQDAGPGQQPQGPGRPEHGQQPPQYGESPGPPPYQEPSTPQYPQYPSPPPYGYSYPSDAQPAEPA